MKIEIVLLFFFFGVVLDKWDSSHWGRDLITRIYVKNGNGINICQHDQWRHYSFSGVETGQRMFQGRKLKKKKKHLVHLRYIQIQQVQVLSPFPGYKMRSIVEALHVNTEF